LTRIAGRRVVVMALDRDHAPGPAAYRKAQRALDLATRLNLPVVSLIDTRGADLSAAAEAGGIAWGIGALIQAMLEAPVPILCVVTGTGGSGGGLAFATGDVLLAYSDTIFWVIAPEAAAEILWRDVERASEAARLLKLTAGDLAAMGIVDAVVASPLGPDSLRSVLVHHLALLTEKETSPSDRAATRQRRWRTIGGS
jgi:acetyl-CoA carboxylase alpha subunit